jgi:hypothetical protein
VYVTVCVVVVGLRCCQYPNPADPLNGEAAGLLIREPERYEARVKGGCGHALWVCGALLAATRRPPNPACVDVQPLHPCLPLSRPPPHPPAPPHPHSCRGHVHFFHAEHVAKYAGGPGRGGAVTACVSPASPSLGPTTAGPSTASASAAPGTPSACAPLSPALGPTSAACGAASAGGASVAGSLSSTDVSRAEAADGDGHDDDEDDEDGDGHDSDVSDLSDL